MENMDYDLRSVQEVRNLARLGQILLRCERITFSKQNIQMLLRQMHVTRGSFYHNFHIIHLLNLIK